MNSSHQADVYAYLFPENALLPDSLAMKGATKRFIARVDLEIGEGGNLLFPSSASYAHHLRDGEELLVELV